MPTTTPKKNYLFGGIVLCAFPATVLLAMHIDGARLPMPVPILFALFFLHGIRTVLWSLFKLNLENTASWVVDSVGAAGFAWMAFWVALYETEGWSGGIPFVPNSWNQNFARILFAGGGVIATLFAARCLRKAFNQYRKRPDDGMGHI